MDPISIASLVAAGVKGIGGLIQGIGGANKQKNLWNNRPQLGVTAGETANDNLYNSMANVTEMPGQSQFVNKLDQTYAEGVSNAQKTAVSSLGATQGAIDLSGKKMDAIQNLAGQFAEFKNQRQSALSQWNNQKSQNEMQRFQVNQYDPWQMQYGQAVGQKQAGFNNMGSGVDTGLGIMGDMAGTNKLMEMLQGMQTNWGQQNFKSTQSSPLGNTYNPQENLLKTLSGLVHK